MTIDERNALLASMTDEVGELVLDDNRAQTLALAIARRQALPMVNVHARYLNQLEAEGWLNRALEFLPNDKQLAERQAAGAGLTTPEFAVLLAYTKTTNIGLIVDSNLPDDPYLEPELVRYFPKPLQQRFPEQIARHRLRREIIATQIGNQMVNISGISFDHRITEDTGVGVVDITRAWVAARDIFDIVDAWDQIEALGADVRLDTQLELFLEARRMFERGVSWILRHRRPPIDIQAVVGAVRRADAPRWRRASTTCCPAACATRCSRSRPAGWPRACPRSSPSVRRCGRCCTPRSTSSSWPSDARREPAAVARMYWQVFEALDIGWLWDAIGALPRSDRWQTQARSALRDDLLIVLADLTDECLLLGSVDEWMAANERVVARTDGDVHRDPPRRELRHHHADRRAAPAAQPRPHRAARRLTPLPPGPAAFGSTGSVGRAMDAPRFRFAPSPTGFFHVGGARTALYNWALARQSGGTFVLRIEDTDEARNRPEWTDGIIDALAWIGISSTDPTFEGPYFQSQYADQHVAAAQQPVRRGPRVLLRPDRRADPGARRRPAASRATTATRATAAWGPGPARCCASVCPRASTVVHDAVRGEVTFDNADIEDFVLLRGNGSPVFLLANVVDDIEMRISHVIRAEEHLPNTPKQQMLWEALGHTPPVWAHVPVVVNEQRKKLSKRRDKVALERYRDEGYLADAMVNYLMTLGWAPKGDTEIVPWARSRPSSGSRTSPTRRRSSTSRSSPRSTASTSGRCRSTSSSSRASRGSQQWRTQHPTVEWEQPVWRTMAPLRADADRRAGRGAGLRRLPVAARARDDEASVAKAVGVAAGPRDAGRDDRRVRDGRRGIATR